MILALKGHCIQQQMSSELLPCRFAAMQTAGPAAKQPSKAAVAAPVTQAAARPAAGSPDRSDAAVASLQSKFDALAVGTDAGGEPAEQLPASSKDWPEEESPARLPVRRHATLLCLDDRLQALPWEALPGLRQAR